MSFDTHPEIDGLTLFSADPGPHEHAVHSHDAFSIIVLTSGAKLFRHGTIETVVRSHQIAIANPDEPHGCGPIDNAPWAHRTWYVSQTLGIELAGLTPAAHAPRLQTPLIDDRKLAQRLIDAHQQARQGNRLHRQTSAIGALTEVFERYATCSSKSEPALEPDSATLSARMQAYEQSMQTDPDTDLTELARTGGVHRNQVIRDFRALHGTTPAAYLRHLRLNTARSMISEGTKLADIAAQLGFADQSHFTRSFREAFGVTPAKYQALAKQSEGAVPL